MIIYFGCAKPTPFTDLSGKGDFQIKIYTHRIVIGFYFIKVNFMAKTICFSKLPVLCDGRSNILTIGYAEGREIMAVAYARRGVTFSRSSNVQLTKIIQPNLCSF